MRQRYHGAAADWLSQVTDALARPGVGLVTCLYTGEAAREGHRLWSALAAMGTSYDFLPNVVLGISLGLAAPCMGSTIALTRNVLDEIGGFAAFADYLADDYEIGRAVRGAGLCACHSRHGRRPYRDRELRPGTVPP